MPKWGHRLTKSGGRVWSEAEALRYDWNAVLKMTRPKHDDAHADEAQTDAKPIRDGWPDRIDRP